MPDFQDLTLEHLRAIRTDIGDLRTDTRDIKPNYPLSVLILLTSIPSRIS
jgi:hypothetical protein